MEQLTLDIFTKLEQKWLHTCDSKTRILSIDGGGTSGAISGASLIALEDQIKSQTNPDARISDFFDIVAGTGIGAIYAAMLVADDGSGRPLYSARESVSFLKLHRSEMFKAVGLRRRLSRRALENVLQKAFTRESDGRVMTLKDTCKPVLVPCFDLLTSAPFVFSRAGATESLSFDFELWKVCRAALATPGAFKAFELTSVDGKTSCLGVDGGLVMNNPASGAVTHVLHNKLDFPSVNGVDDLLVLSLGNGTSVKPNSVRRNCDTATVVDIALDGVSDTVDQLLGNAFCWNRADYVRIQCYGTEEEMMKEKGVETLSFGGKRMLTETNGQRIESFAQRLVAAGKSSLPQSPVKAVTPVTDGR